MTILGKNTRFHWLGLSAFHAETPGGKSILIDPWPTNPSAPESAKNISRVDLILVSVLELSLGGVLE
ncbi:MAG: MBL fold metallo-hydrolase [Ignavibacteriales bacterium]|nr:MBL fold metallo-hydrolase [Ignavibacteriales bacterium]